jgi:peptidoglycan/LPS O-acetylase OafA/YrhL
VLDARPLRRLGLSSYSLYLTHGPIVVVLYEKVIGGRVGHGGPSFLLAVAVIVPAAVLFARGFAAAFELPFQRHRGWPPGLRAAVNAGSPRRERESARSARAYSHRAAS